MTPVLTAQQLETLTSGVRIVALRLLGDADAARDVAQETMARLLDALAKGQLRDPARLGAFARGIAHHVIVDHQRAAGRLTALPDDLSNDSEPDALDALVWDEEVARVRAALARLSKEDRELLRLTFVENLSPGAVAARLREPAERVRKRKSRALQRLREVFFGSVVGHILRPSPTMDQAKGNGMTSAEAE